MTDTTHSLRGQTRLREVWAMVSRSADTEFRHSLPLLVLTVSGMLGLYLVPPLAAIGWPLHGELAVVALGLAGWLSMSLAYCQPSDSIAWVRIGP